MRFVRMTEDFHTYSLAEKDMFQITDVDDILRVFHERGNRHYGEEVSELQHALQAAEFAGQFGEPECVVLSCLLHDFGHMLHDLGEEIEMDGMTGTFLGVDERFGMLLRDGGETRLIPLTALLERPD